MPSCAAWEKQSFRQQTLRNSVNLEDWGTILTAMSQSVTCSCKLDSFFQYEKLPKEGLLLHAVLLCCFKFIVPFEKPSDIHFWMQPIIQHSSHFTPQRLLHFVEQIWKACFTIQVFEAYLSWCGLFPVLFCTSASCLPG